MRLLLFLLLLVSFDVKAQYTLAGYINTTDPGGSSQACAVTTGVTTAIYTVGGTLDVGQTVYATSTGTLIANDFGYHPFSATSGGTVTFAIQIWGDGNIQTKNACSGGGGGGGSSAGFAPAPTAWGNKIKPIVLLDMSRYDVRGGGGYGLRYFFDDSTNTLALPWRNPEGYYLKGDANVNKINYFGNRGLRWIMDLVGDSNINDLSKKYVFRDTAYAYDNVFGGGSAIYMASLDSVLANVIWSNRWVYFARPDSMLRPFAVMFPNDGASSGGAWRKFKTRRNDSARYVICWAVRDTTGGSGTNYPNFSEISFYGTPNFDTASVKRWVDYTPTKEKRNFGKFAGVNVGTGYWKKYLQHRYGLRYYAWSAVKWDASNTATGSETYDANPYNDFNIFTHTFDTLNDSGNIPWLAIQGGNQKYLTDAGLSDGNKVPHMDYGLESESPHSFQRSARFYRNFAAKFGRNTAGLSSGSLQWNGDNPTGLGLTWFDRVENGNEEALRSGLTELGYFFKSQMDYDGYAGLYSNTGLRSADTTMKLLMSATYLLDSNRTKLFVYLSHFLRPDSLFIWANMNEHHYSSTLNNKIDYNPRAEDQVGEKGTTAEDEGLRYKLAAHKRSNYRYLRRSDVPYEITEFGYDNYSQPMPDAGGAGFYTIYGTPSYVGFDSVQSKAISIEGSIMEHFFSGVDGVVEFITENPCLCPNNNAGTFATAGEAQSAGFDMQSSLTYPVHHVKNYLSQMLMNYDTVETIVGTGNYRLYKLRHNTITDSVCYYLRYHPLDGGSSSVTINVGNVAGNGTKKYLNFTNTAPTESAAVVSGGNVSAVAQARAQYFFFLETSTGAPLKTKSKIKGRIKIR